MTVRCPGKLDEWYEFGILAFSQSGQTARPASGVEVLLDVAEQANGQGRDLGEGRPHSQEEMGERIAITDRRGRIITSPGRN